MSWWTHQYPNDLHKTILVLAMSVIDLPQKLPEIPPTCVWTVPSVWLRPTNEVDELTEENVSMYIKYNERQNIPDCCRHSFKIQYINLRNKQHRYP